MEEVAINISGAVLLAKKAQLRAYLAQVGDQLAEAEARVGQMRVDRERVTGALLLLDELMAGAPTGQEAPP